MTDSTWVATRCWLKRHRQTRETYASRHMRSRSRKTTGTTSPEGHATNQPKWQNLEKSRWTVRATVVGGHATVGRLSNNVFWTFQAIWNFFEKSHWTVTRQWSEVTRPSADCQTTFFGRFKQFEIFLKKVTERSRDKWPEVTRPSADCQAHICMNKRERERERETISVTLHTGTAMLCRWPFHQPASRLRLALTRVVDRQGQLVYEYCKSSHWQVEFMLCAICRSTFTRQFSRVLTPGPSSLDFFTGISRKRYVVLRRLCL